MPITPPPAGVAPFRCTTTSASVPSCSRCRSRHAKLWWFSMPSSPQRPVRARCALDERVVRGRISSHHSIAAQYSWPASDDNPATPLSAPSAVPGAARARAGCSSRRLRAGTAAAGVAQQREVFARRDARGRVEHGELAELDEMVAASTGAELRPSAVLHPCRHAETRQSASMTSCCRRFWKAAPIPKRVSRSMAWVRRLWSVASVSTGSSSTVSFILHAMSTPTAYGMTASFVASTPPMGSP